MAQRDREHAGEPAPDHRRARFIPTPDQIALSCLVIFATLAIWNRLVFDTWIARFDFFSFFVPWYAYLGQQLRALSIPGWNPHLFSGTPFLGDPESGWMYFPAMIAMTLFPVITGFKAMAAIQLTIAGLSTYALGRTLKLGPGAAMVAAVAYVVGPLLQWNTYCCLVLAGFAVWTPLLLLGIERAFLAHRWRDRVLPIIAAAFAFSQMLAGWVGQGWLMAPILVIAYCAYRMVLPWSTDLAVWRERIITGVGIGAGVGIGGAGLAAAGLLPRLDVNLQSNLSGANYSGRGAEGMLNPPWSLEYLFIHTLGAGYDHRQAAWAAGTVVLALLAPFVARNRHQVPFFVGLLVVSLIMTLPATPLHHLFYLIPGFQELHEHDSWRIYTVGLISPAILAGATVENLRQRRFDRWLAPVALLPVILIALSGWLFGQGDWTVRWSPTYAAIAMTAVVLAALLLPENPRWRGQAVLAGVAALLIFWQPTGWEITGSWLGWPADPTWQRHWKPDPIVASTLESEVQPTDPGGAGEFLQQQMRESGPFRYVGYGGSGYPGDTARADSYMGRRFDPVVHALLVNGRPMFLGLDEIQGYNPIELLRYEEFMTALNGEAQNYHLAYLLPTGTGSPLLDLLDVQYVVVDATIPKDRSDIVALQQGRHLVFHTDKVDVYARDTTLPHAWLTHEVQTVQRGEALPLLTGRKIDPYKTALIEGEAPAVGQPAAGAAESVTVDRSDDQGLTMRVNAAAPGVLVVSEMYANGWRAAVDGVSTPVYPTDHALQGIAVPAGEHTVTLRYQPTSIRLGLAITGLTVLLMAIALVWSWRSRRSVRGQVREST